MGPLGCILSLRLEQMGGSLYTDKGHAKNQSYLTILADLALDLATLRFNGLLTLDFSEIQSNCEQTLLEHKIGPSAKSWDIDLRWDQEGPVELGCTLAQIFLCVKTMFGGQASLGPV